MVGSNGAGSTVTAVSTPGWRGAYAATTPPTATAANGTKLMTWLPVAGVAWWYAGVGMRQVSSSMARVSIDSGRGKTVPSVD
jgi:hypothetical protein